jgi:hypothetical protein
MMGMVIAGLMPRQSLPMLLVMYRWIVLKMVGGRN